MSLDTFNACVEGYNDRLFDQKCLGVQQGFWAGYYGNSQRPKKLSFILEMMEKSHRKLKQKELGKPNAAKPDVDVEQFLERERLFNEQLARAKAEAKARGDNVG